MKIILFSELSKITPEERAVSLARAMDTAIITCGFSSLTNALDAWKTRFPHIQNLSWCSCDLISPAYVETVQPFTNFIGLRVNDNVLIWNGKNDEQDLFTFFSQRIEWNDFWDKLKS